MSTQRTLRRQAPWTIGVLCLFLTASGALVGCASESASIDPLADLRSEKLSPDRRIAAVDQAWEGVQNGTLERLRVREEFKKDIFLMSTGDAVRLRMVEKLLSDTEPGSVADTRKFLRLRLPTERSWPIIELVSRESAARGWTDMTPALVRSFSRQVPDPVDDQRPERAALLALHPGEPLDKIVYDVFIGEATAPVTAAPAAPKVTAAGTPEPARFGATKSGRSFLDQKVQSDAWALLTRLDKDGSRRATLLASDERVTGADGQDPVLADLRAAARDLRAVPATGPELEWLKSLRAPGNTVNQAWWRAAAEAIARLTPAQAAGLELRHAEPVRWAAANRPAWLSMTRDQLLDEVRSRLNPRKTYARTAERSDAIRSPAENIREWDAELTWGDLLTVLVIDEALGDPRVRAAIIDQASEDHANRQTEYGGALEAVWPGSDPARAAEGTEGGFDARLYLPPVAARALPEAGGDTRFVASEQMMVSTPRALAHYHFHVQNEHNDSFAGPSRGDLDYAASYARNNLVFTSIKDGVLDADYYQRNGARIDLGELRR